MKPLNWLPALDPIHPQLVMDLRIDYLAPEAMGASAAAPDGQRQALLPIAGGRASGLKGLHGQVQPGAMTLPRVRADGVACDTTTLLLRLDDGNSVIVELRGMGAGPQRRVLLRCTVNRGPHDWLNSELLMATVSEELLSTPGADGVQRREHLHVYAIDPYLPPELLASYQSPSDTPAAPPLRTEHVLNIAATCSAPEAAGLSPHAPDGVRTEIWPIIGGAFRNADASLAGEVVAGGGDYPFIRPDGCEWVEALYRLRATDGSAIVIHNKGFYREGMCRLQPEFIATAGPHDWLNRSLFIGTLVFPVPASQVQATSAEDNDRLIQIHRVL